MEFQTAYSHKSGKNSPYRTSHGSRYQTTYIETILENGDPGLKESGSIDLQELHETGRDLCDIKTLVKRFAQGDISALEQRDGFFADVADFPTTPQDVAKLAVEARSLFMTQTAAERAEYGNSVNKWLEAIMSGDEKALASIGIKATPAAVEVSNDNVKSTTEIVEEEVKSE